MLLLKLICYALFFSIGMKAQAENRYCNERFDFCVSYPADFKKEAEPANGDGQAFYDERGFSMIVSGMNNVMDYTLHGLQTSQRRDFDRITYQAKGNNWFVLSGYKGNAILYVKFYLNPQTINALYLRYPKNLQTTYAPLVTQIVKSFTPGAL